MRRLDGQGGAPRIDRVVPRLPRAFFVEARDLGERQVPHARAEELDLPRTSRQRLLDRGARARRSRR